MWPKFLGYVVSFLLLGIYWVGHRNQFNFIRRADQNFHWLNIFFFGVVCLVPFSTGVLSRYPDVAAGRGDLRHQPDPDRGGAVPGVDLCHPPIPPGRCRPVPEPWYAWANSAALLAPACYLVAMLAGLIDPRLSLVIYALVPLLYIFPGLQHFWTYLAHR